MWPYPGDDAPNPDDGSAKVAKTVKMAELAGAPTLALPAPVEPRQDQGSDQKSATHSSSTTTTDAALAPVHLGAHGILGARGSSVTASSELDERGGEPGGGGEHGGVLIIEGESTDKWRDAHQHSVGGQICGLFDDMSRSPIAPPPRPRRWPPMLLVSALTILIVTLALSAGRTPLGNMTITQVQDGDVDLALQTLANPNSAHQPTGPWDTSAGVVELGQGGGAGPGVQAPGSAGLPTTQQGAGAATPATGATPSPTARPQATPTKTASPKPAPTKASGGSGTGGDSSGANVSPAPLSPWPPTNPWIAPPGKRAFQVNSSGGYYWWAFGQCTWWAQYQRQDENLRRMGNAQYWAAGAKKRGYPVGTTPRKGATVVFQPGVEGAGGAGHVAHVVAVYPGGWFLVSEMNFYWNGGGWGRVDYRYAYARSGVSFIY